MLLEPLLPDRGERGSEIEDKRRTVMGAAHPAPLARHAGAVRQLEFRVRALLALKQARDMRIWDAAFETLASLGPPAHEEHAINSTIVRAHQHAAGVKGGSKSGSASAVRVTVSPPKSTSGRPPKTTL